MIFKVLSPGEKAEYQQYAQDSLPPDMKSWSVYHPVCRAVWLKRGIGLSQPLTDDQFVFEHSSRHIDEE